MKVLRILLIIVGLFGILDTIFVLFLSNVNLGVLLPAILGLPLLIAGLFLPQFADWSRAGIGLTVKWLFIGAYALAALLFIGTSFVISRAAHVPAPKDADAVIVLGAGLRGDRPTLILAERLNTAMEYMRDNPKSVAILSGGQGAGEIVTEASVMGEYMRSHGIAQERIILEEASTSTEENFRYSRAIMEERFGADASAVFVTTGFHVYRAGLVAEKQGLTAVGIPSADRWYMRLNNYLRECVALWFYRILGKT